MNFEACAFLSLVKPAWPFDTAGDGDSSDDALELVDDDGGETVDDWLVSSGLCCPGGGDFSGIESVYDFSKRSLEECERITPY